MTDRLVAGMRCSEAGDLAAGFVVGALEPAEMDRVRAHLAECPEAHAEFAELGSAVPALLAAVPQAEPPSALRDRILSAARADGAARSTDAARATDTMTRAADTMTHAADTMTRPAPARAPAPATEGRGGLFGFLNSPRPGWALAGVAAVIAIALGVQTLRLQAEVAQDTMYRAQVAAVFQAAAQPGSQLAILGAGAGASYPAGIAAVQADGSVQLAIHGLTPTTGSQVYEAWVIAGSAAPQPIGGFTVGSTGSATFASPLATTSTAGVVVALTLEPAAGAKTPTLPIIASGVAQPPPS